MQYYDSKKAERRRNRGGEDFEDDEIFSEQTLTSHQFKDERLQKTALEAKQLVLRCIAKFNQLIYANKKYWEGGSTDVGSLLWLVMQNTTLVTSSIKFGLIRGTIEALPEGRQQNIKINRLEALEFYNKDECDDEGKHTMFGQLL